jgi:uncharacterized protein YecE (DUF72 family)
LVSYFSDCQGGTQQERAPAGLPVKAQLQSWKEQTGADFIFSWKASKFITHWKRIGENSANSLDPSAANCEP